MRLSVEEDEAFRRFVIAVPIVGLIAVAMVILLALII